MAVVVESPRVTVPVRSVVLTVVGLVVLSACLTVLFLSMRAVMDMGGSCGSGGPYEIARPCPKGVGWLLPVSIWIGLVGLGLYVAGTHRLPGPHLAALAWPALFLSLGWNFWDFAWSPPDGSDGPVWGWLVSGVIFVLMGGLPLYGILRSGSATRSILWSDGPGDEAAPGGVRRAVAEARPHLRPTAATGPTARTSTATATDDDGDGDVDRPDAGVDDLAEDLERLTELHRQGALTDSEFRAAKARRITGEAP